MCGNCVHIMRIKGGQPLFLCVLCSHKCEPIQVAEPKKKKKNGLLALFDTVKLKFNYRAAREKSQR